jgi:hypothetical protein
MRLPLVIAFVLWFTVAGTLASPLKRAADGVTQHENALDAINLSNTFASLTPNSRCNDGEVACINESFAKCAGGKFVLTPCSQGTLCVVLPLVNKRGTSVTCGE